MRKFKLLSLMVATVLFVGLYSCGGGSATKEEVKEVETEAVEEMVEEPVAVDSVEVGATDSVAVEEEEVAEEPAE